jgi:hypothetical protein
MGKLPACYRHKRLHVVPVPLHHIGSYERIGEGRRVSSVHFEFVINHSFLAYDWHPITVPRGAVDYMRLEAERLHEGEFILVFPRGERATAKMISDVAGYGRYYQLKLTGRNRAIPSYVRAGSHVYVFLACMGGKNHAILEEVAP